MLKLGADCKSCDSIFGRSAVCIAALNGHSAVVNCLMEASASVDQRDNEGRTPLMHCVTQDEGHKILSVLFSAAAEVNATNALGRTALHLAVESQRFRSV